MSVSVTVAAEGNARAKFTVSGEDERVIQPGEHTTVTLQPGQTVSVEQEVIKAPKADAKK